MTAKKRWSPVPVIYAIFLVVPIYWLVTISLKTTTEVSTSFTLYPHEITLENYVFILNDPSWFFGYINATAYVSMNVLMSVMVGVPAAYAFARYQFFGSRFLFFGLLACRMISPAVLLVPFVQIFSDLQLIDTYIAVAISHGFFNLPLAIWILEGFISKIPVELDESARIDGYSVSHFFLRILLPLIAPGIAVTAFFCFMFSWIETLLSNALTVVHAKPIGAIMSRAGSVLAADVPLYATASLLGMIPGLLLIIFMRRHLTRGFSMGRVV
jgi:glycerol transport system permease protein